MTISIGYMLGNIFEFLLFIYFSNTSFYPKKTYIKSILISFFAYVALFAIGTIGSASISIFSFFIINVILLTLCYSIKLRNAIFFSIILDALSCLGEYIVIYALGVRYENGWVQATFTLYQSIAIISIEKGLYLVGILFLKHFTVGKNIYDSETPIVLTIIPMLTMICLTSLMMIEIDTLFFLLLCTVFLLINFVTFYINAELNNKNGELKFLQNKLSEYQLISEKYENTKIMRHDFHKQLEVLKDLIAADNIKAKEYMRQIQFSQRELDYAQYTDNKILNVLFSQKVKECHKRGIEIHIHSTSPTLSFISDIDTVAIFSNMIDNAIEASEQAETKEIYVDLYTVNDSFSVVKVENYTDKEPVILDGTLRTQKENTDIHGMGIKSINNALKQYNSELTWTYDKEKKFFRAIALIHIPDKTAFRHDYDSV